jgi:hypothetical protein
MIKIDFKKELKHLYNPSKKEFSIVDVPVMKFLMIDGQGNPNTAPAYQQAVEALYGTAFPLKFVIKKQGFDYTVPPLEGLWWVDDMSEFSVEVKDQWKWTMMIMQPEQVTPELVEQIRGEVIKKKDLPSLSKLRFETYKESLCVQIMYIGPYADEGPTIARMHAFIEAEGYIRNGKHHEIYLGDPRRTAPEKLKTVIRQPVLKVDSSN